MTRRVAVCGIGTESSTFSAHRTTVDDFTLWTDISRYPFLEADASSASGWWPGTRVEFVPLLVARALPGGPVTREAYTALESRLLAALTAEGPFDAVYLDLHGAMHVEGRDDAEAGLAAAIRAIIGRDRPIAASMDLHGQVSRRFAELVDLPTAYRTAPHVDMEETRERACRLLVHALTKDTHPPAEGTDPLTQGTEPLSEGTDPLTQGTEPLPEGTDPLTQDTDPLPEGTDPPPRGSNLPARGAELVRAWVRVPLLLPGERTSTRLDPAAAIYARLPEVSRRPGVLDASIWIGYAWADAPRTGVDLLVSGTCPDAVTEAAAELARALWRARDDYAFAMPALSPRAAIETALAAPARPYFVSDSGDNPTAGGSGDAAWFLADLLATPSLAAGEKTAIWASCADPAAVAACVAAGAGAAVELRVGGVFSGDPPVPLRGVVHAVRPGDPVGGDLAVVRSGGVHAVLTTRRKPYHFIADLTELGLDPWRHDLTAVKIGYLEPDLHRAAAGSVLALTPGGVSQDLAALPYRRLTRPIHPLDPDMPAPDLTPVLLRSAARRI
ncbi:M81 family metallopeptidase [Nonomuraea typhae]|uniref:M81 family metallopeptidase n=1 Tax=Nonomuraea typhae TaxID=2603600 RepID=A0ABW7YPD3_9ACTN